MSKKELCFQCLEDMTDSEKQVLENTDPIWWHCHHEPKEKPVCWCHITGVTTGTKDFMQWWKSLYPHHKFDIKFCPKCGRKL